MPPAGTDTVVMKFGGTSVADAERIQRAARDRERQGGRERGGGAVGPREAPDELVSLAYEVSPTGPTRARWTCCSPPASA